MNAKRKLKVESKNDNKRIKVVTSRVDSNLKPSKLQKIIKTSDLKSEFETKILELQKSIKEKDEKIKGLEESTAMKQIIVSEQSQTLKTKEIELQKMKEEVEKLTKDKTTLCIESRELKETIKGKNREIDAYKKIVDDYVSELKQLNNRILDLKGNIRVYLRLNNLNPKEFTSTKILNESKLVLNKNEFTFDKIINNSNNSTVFNEIQDLLYSSLHGYDVNIFAYGSTGSGKTYTLLSDSGLVVNTIGYLYNRVTDYNLEVELSASCLEVYNEQIYDLTNNNLLKINSQSSVIDLNVVKCVNEMEMFNFYTSTLKNRKSSNNSYNSRSSRSHCVFTIHLKQTQNELSNAIHFIDLAGSERLNEEVLNDPVLLKETQNINKSLSALKDVLLSLYNKSKHIPFRNSKLTFLLQNSLQGKVAMICCVKDDLQESVNTCRFASVVNQIVVGSSKSVRVAVEGLSEESKVEAEHSANVDDLVVKDATLSE